MKIKKLPKEILKTNIFVKIPLPKDEEEEGLKNVEEDVSEYMEVAMVNKECKKLKKGDKVLVSTYANPIGAFIIGEYSYIMYREADIEAIW